MALRRRPLIFVLSSVTILLVAIPCLFVYALGGFHQNDAETAFRPIGQDLEASGARPLCSTGDAGFGPDNTAPWYHTIYEVPVVAQPQAPLVAIAEQYGYRLTRRATSEDPTGERFLQGTSSNRTLTMTLLSAAQSALDCGSSTVPPADGKELLEVQLAFPSRTDGATEPLAPEATETPGTPQVPWYQSKFSTFAPFVAAGSGNGVVTLPPTAVTGALTVSHTGSGTFTIAAVDHAGALTGERIVDTAGDYSGVVPFGLHGVGSVATSLTISSSGPWSISLAPLASVPAIGFPAEGSGDQVFRYDGRAGDWMVTNTNTNGGTFDLRQYFGDIATDAAYSGEGDYSGNTPINAGPSLIVITSSDHWTISPSG
jgi:hypothetical protein